MVFSFIKEKERVADYDYVKELKQKMDNMEKEESKRDLEKYIAVSEQVKKYIWNLNITKDTSPVFIGKKEHLLKEKKCVFLKETLTIFDMLCLLF